MKLTIVGTGYVGLVTGVCLSKIGHDVTCVDIDAARVEQISRGVTPIYEPRLEDLLREQLAQDRFRATTRLREAVQSGELTMIAVGTPFDGSKIDLQFVERAADDIGAALRDIAAWHVVVVKSTVVPTTADSVIAPRLAAASGREIGTAIGIATNPEFLREGSAVDDFLDPDRIVVGGFDERSLQKTLALYEAFDCPKVATTLRNAELIKYSSNALLATMISFSNEIAAICERVPGLDVETVMDGVQLDRRLSPRVGHETVHPGILSYLRAGAGFGGSCLPKDVNALRAFAQSRGSSAPLLTAVISVNQHRAEDLVSNAEATVGDLENRKVAVLGLAFKPGTDDTRESPAIALIEALLRKKADVGTYDPIAPLPRALAGRVRQAASVGDALKGASAAFIATAWPEFLATNWPPLLDTMQQPVVIDGRNALRGVVWPSGARYVPVGTVPQS